MITATRLKSDVCTDITQPSLSLIKGICYPESCQFKSKASTWGCEHEAIARECHIETVELDHLEFQV